MKKLTLTLALIGLISAMPAQADVDSSQWAGAELLWSEYHGDYVPLPTLGDDPFLEKLVWSDRHGEYITAAMAKSEALRAYRKELVWSDFHGDYLPRSELEPCPSDALAESPQRLAGLFD
jgi:hypothetical protein